MGMIILLAYVQFSVLGMHVVSVLDLPDRIPHPATINKEYLLQFLRIFAQYIMFNQANQSNNALGGETWTFGRYKCILGHLLACCIQITLIWLLVLLHKFASQDALVITVCMFLIWSQFAVHPVDNALPANEQIDAILAFSLTGIFVSDYQWHKCYKTSRPLPFWLLKLPLLAYFSSLGIWFAFRAIVSAPSDRFYYNSRWCGMASNKAGSIPPYSCAYT